MEFRDEGNVIVLRLDRGDEIISSVENVCSELNVLGGQISGIGAAFDVAINTYLPKKDIYREDIYSGILEIVSLNGNVTMQNGTQKAHIHAVFSYVGGDENPRLVGGHLKSCIISHTAEIFIIPVKPIKRIHDENLRIEIWDL